jgi:hypothetical protein
VHELEVEQSDILTVSGRRSAGTPAQPEEEGVRDYSACTFPFTARSETAAKTGAISGSCHAGYTGGRIRGPRDQIGPQDPNQGWSLCCQEIQGRFIVIDVAEMAVLYRMFIHDVAFLNGSAVTSASSV